MMETVAPKSVVVKPVEIQTNPAPTPVVSPQMPVGSTGVLEQKAPVRQSAAPVIAADSALDGAETAKKTETAPEKHKKGLFGMGFGKTEKPAKKKTGQVRQFQEPRNSRSPSNPRSSRDFGATGNF